MPDTQCYLLMFRMRQAERFHSKSTPASERPEHACLNTTLVASRISSLPVMLYQLGVSQYLLALDQLAELPDPADAAGTPCLPSGALSP